MEAKKKKKKRKLIITITIIIIIIIIHTLTRSFINNFSKHQSKLYYIILYIIYISISTSVILTQFLFPFLHTKRMKGIYFIFLVLSIRVSYRQNVYVCNIVSPLFFSPLRHFLICISLFLKKITSFSPVLFPSLIMKPFVPLYALYYYYCYFNAFCIFIEKKSFHKQTNKKKSFFFVYILYANGVCLPKLSSYAYKQLKNKIK